MKALSREMVDHLGVLIDAENISARYVVPLFSEIASLGTATVRRIYGDWTLPEQGRWKNALNSNAIIPVQQFRLTSGKNSTDCALIIDAMDLLYTGNFDGFCIVSSDGDFTRLACRLRQSGLVVYGFGEEKTPGSFVQACDRFIKLEILGVADAEAMGTGPDDAEARSSPEWLVVEAQPSRAAIDTPCPTLACPPTSRSAADRNIIDLLKTGYEAVAGEDGWTSLAAFGAQLLKLSPSFDCRDYGSKRLGEFILSTHLFDVKKVPTTKNSTSTAWYIRARMDPSLDR